MEVQLGVVRVPVKLRVELGLGLGYRSGLRIGLRGVRRSHRHKMDKNRVAITRYPVGYPGKSLTKWQK